MTDKTSTVKKSATIDDPDQASTNFYWTYSYLMPDGREQNFNLQTTIRGILQFDQIQDHIKSALEAAAHICDLGGMAKQVGKNAYETPTAPMPTVAPIETLVKMPEPTTQAPMPLPNFPDSAPATTAPAAPAAPSGDDSFMAETIQCTVTNNKQYFHIKGGPWKLYGVKVWPEVLVSVGIPYTKLEAGQLYPMTGYKATYSKKADGKPDKVTKLEKVA